MYELLRGNCLLVLKLGLWGGDVSETDFRNIKAPLL